MMIVREQVAMSCRIFSAFGVGPLYRPLVGPIIMATLSGVTSAAKEVEKLTDSGFRTRRRHTAGVFLGAFAADVFGRGERERIIKADGRVLPTGTLHWELATWNFR